MPGVVTVQKLPDLPRWESKFPEHVLRAKASGREVGGGAMWLQGFRMQCLKPGDLKFPSFSSCHEYGLILSEIARRQLPTYVGVDLSSSHRPGNAIVAVAVDPGTRRRFPVEVRHGAWSSPETADMIGDVCNNHPNLQYVMVENNAYQEALIDWIKKGKKAHGWWTKIEAHTTGRNKADPEFGLPGLEVEFANRAWGLPAGEWEGHEQGHDCSWCVFARQFSLYPKFSHDDFVMACHPAGTSVMTARGPVPIEWVREGDMVLTHRGRFRRVTGTTSRQFDGELVGLKAAGARKFWATPGHPVLAARPYFLRDGTNRLRPGAWAWDPIESVRAGRKMAGDFLRLPAPAEWPESSSTRFDLATFASPIGRRSAWKIGVEEMSCKGKSIPRFLGIDKEAAFLIGLYLAEGSIGRHGTLVGFSFNENEAYLVEFVKQQCRRLFNANVGIKVAGGTIVASVQSAIAARFFAQLGKHDGKGMPWGWMGWPIDLRLAVVRGWLVGDGHVRRPSGVPSFSAVTISRVIESQVLMTLWAAGLEAVSDNFEQPVETVIKGRRVQSTAAARRVTVTSRSSALLLVDPIWPEEIRWRGMAPKVRERTNSRLLATPEGMVTRPSSVDRIWFSGTVYNLHVEEDESFTAEGVAVHNCWFAKTAIDKWGARAPRSSGPRRDINTR